MWLIAAKIGDVDTCRDSFKLKAITYDLPSPPPGGGGGAVPEPSTWAMLILGMGTVGGAMRGRSLAHGSRSPEPGRGLGPSRLQSTSSPQPLRGGAILFIGVASPDPEPPLP